MKIVNDIKNLMLKDTDKKNEICINENCKTRLKNKIEKSELLEKIERIKKRLNI